MTISRKGRYRYATDNADIQAEIVRFSRLNEHDASRFSAACCPCGSDTFQLETDEEAGVGKRVCAKCGDSRLMGDSAQYAAEASLDHHLCVCDATVFALTSGVALYADSNDVRWFYIGCRCQSCNLVGVFAHWKCEGGDADDFLANT